MNEQAFVQRFSTQEKLLLAQAVYKLGAAQWEGISKLLLEHPVLLESRGADEAVELFSPKACEEGYVGLMTDIGVNV
jgi:bromodomain-containing protein 8